MISAEWKFVKRQQNYDKAKDKLSGRMLLLAEAVTAYAKRYSPYLTGHNRSSITMELYYNGRRLKDLVESGFTLDPSTINFNNGWAFRVYTQSGYGGWLELGTSRMQAQPYIFPAWQSTYAKMKTFFGKAL